MAGSPAGVPPEALRRAFGWFVLAMAAFILVQEVPQSTWQPLSPLAKTAVSATAALVALGLGLFGQHLGRRVDARHEAERLALSADPTGAAAGSGTGERRS